MQTGLVFSALLLAGLAQDEGKDQLPGAYWTWYKPDSVKGRAPLVVFLHGAGDRPDGGIRSRLNPVADEKKFIWIGIKSREKTWKAGPDDTANITAAIHAALRKFNVDHDRMYITSFSAGGVMLLWYITGDPEFRFRAAATWGSPFYEQAYQKDPAWKPPMQISANRGDRYFPESQKYHALVQSKGFKAVFTDESDIAKGHTLNSRGIRRAYEWMVKQAGGAAPAPQTVTARLKLKEELAERVKAAVERAATGNLSGALKVTDRVILDEASSPAEKKDAEFVRTEIGKLVKKLFEEAGALLARELAYDARALFDEIAEALRGTEDGLRAATNSDGISKDKKLKNILKAGKLYADGLRFAAEGKDRNADRAFKQILRRFPVTEYARLAQERVE